MEREHFLNWVIYQVYPRSFKDSNGDGIGDLQGVIEKLDYLLGLGVNAIWLSPCYKSPNFDNGYDVADYRDIMDDFGTLEDWVRLKDEAHVRGIKIIMDLVFNHTSYQHKWFQEAKSSRDNPYHNYYIWANKPKNNWQSVFGGSAWEYNKDTDEYYLHSFAVQQPDLNWENPKVRQECCDIVDFWVEKGVDGFRCDVLDFIAKDFEKGEMYGGKALHGYIRQLFNRDKVKNVFTVGECKSDEKSIMDICGKEREELTTVFQFDHINLGRKSRFEKTAFSYDEVRDVLVKWQYFCQKHDLLYTLFTDNHDQPYYISRLGNDKEKRYQCATMYATMFFLLRGIPFIYQGQEFGLTNSYFEDITCFNDVETLNYYQEKHHNTKQATLWKKINYGNRDNTRRPMPWTSDESTGFGFSAGNAWLKPPTRAKEINLEADLSSKQSVFVFYKNLLALRRKNQALRYGDFCNCTQGKGYFAYLRTYKDKSVYVVCNFDKTREIELPSEIKDYHLALSNSINYNAYDTKFCPFEVAVYER